MLRSKLIAAVAAGLMMFSAATTYAGCMVPVVIGHKSTHIPAGIWAIFGCAGDVILAAWVAHSVYHRELTQAEALSCGLAFWLNPQKPKP